MDEMTIQELIRRLRFHEHGIPLEDIPEKLDNIVRRLKELGLVELHRNMALKATTLFFTSPNKLKENTAFPFVVFQIRGVGEIAEEKVRSGEARWSNDPYVGTMFVVNQKP